MFRFQIGQQVVMNNPGRDVVTIVQRSTFTKDGREYALYHIRYENGLEYPCHDRDIC